MLSYAALHAVTVPMEALRQAVFESSGHRAVSRYSSYQMFSGPEHVGTVVRDVSCAAPQAPITSIRLVNELVRTTSLCVPDGVDLGVLDDASGLSAVGAHTGSGVASVWAQLSNLATTVVVVCPPGHEIAALRVGANLLRLQVEREREYARSSPSDTLSVAADEIAVVDPNAAGSKEQLDASVRTIAAIDESIRGAMRRIYDIDGAGLELAIGAPVRVSDDEFLVAWRVGDQWSAYSAYDVDAIHALFGAIGLARIELEEKLGPSLPGAVAEWGDHLGLAIPFRRAP